MTKTPTIADRVEALEALLTQKGIVTSEQLDSIVARYADQVGPLNGARLIARAWTDPEFKARLLDDATSVVHEWKLEGGQVDRLIVKENTGTSITSWCAHFALVTHGQSWGFPLSGISRQSIVPELLLNRAPC